MNMALVTKHLIHELIHELMHGDEEQGNAIFTIHFAVKLFNQLLLTRQSISVLKVGMLYGLQSL